MFQESLQLIDENQKIMNRLNEMNAILMMRLSMANSFVFIAPNGEPDPNMAMGYRIQDPNEPDKYFTDHEPTTDVKWFWVIRCSGSMFMDAHGNYTTPKNLRAKTKKEALQKLGGSVIIEPSDLPLFETLDEMFSAYNTYWVKRS